MGASQGLDLSLCDAEPIHVPGAIQPHGALLAARAADGIVTHASANLRAFIGSATQAVLGRQLKEVIGDSLWHKWLGAGFQEDDPLGESLAMPGPDGRQLNLHAFRSGPHLCVDIEPLRLAPGQKSPFAMAQAVLQNFKQATTQAELCEVAVRGLKAITGYDRVMAYRFAEDGSGEVIAEARAAQQEPYLGLRYPASDVPPQARSLYLRMRVGSVPDASYQPVPLLTHAPEDDSVPLDLTLSALRSVAPVHREYMRNMKTAASLTIGLSLGENLWGMLVCHHMTPRVAGPELRAVADMIGQMVSLMLDSLGRGKVNARRLERNATLREVVERIAAPLPLREALAAAQAELLHLVDAEGAVVRFGGGTVLLGRTPPLAAAEPALALLLPWSGGEVLAVDDLGLRFPELAACTRDGSGALLLPLAQDSDDAILWFRPELARTVTWGGKPTEHATADPATGRISPRTSFAAWSESVTGRSAPWEEGDLELARELRSALQAEMAQRVKADLARLRHYDPLTGLANRSLFQERLFQAEHSGLPTALLFFDLDRFKAVNDTLGHAAGDALLVEVSRRLVAVIGADDLAARLGGDEFVVLCQGLERDAAAALGERIRQAIEVPFGIHGEQCQVAASIGIALAGHSNGLDLVRAADMAMYTAKQRGGNRAMVFEPELFDRAARQFELDRDLRDAINRDDQLVLAYQPVFGIADDRRTLVGFEALLRWQHPTRGWMSPDVLIPLAEKLGLIVPLGEWVMSTALKQAHAMQRDRSGSALWLSVNVSGLQLSQSGFCTGLAAMLQAEGFAPAALCLEVTEGMLSDVAVSYVLADVRKLGVRVAIDEFGIGYSSISHFGKLPVDVVKLDRSFLEDVGTSGGDAPFVTAVIALAHAAGMSVIVDGIETQPQLEIAAAAGADMVQGFLFARPLSASAALALVAEQQVPLFATHG